RDLHSFPTRRSSDLTQPQRLRADSTLAERSCMRVQTGRLSLSIMRDVCTSRLPLSPGRKIWCRWLLTIKSTALIWSITSTHLMPSEHTGSPKHGRRPWVTWHVFDPEFPSPLASTTRQILHRHFTLVLRRQTPRSASKEMH